METSANAKRQPPLTIGLTGGIGSGKTTATDRFKSFGIQVIDADVIARQLSERADVEAQIKSHFGPDVSTPEGKLNRKKVREIIFQEPDLKKWLERLLFPLIHSRIQSERENAHSPYVIVSAPLLLESRFNEDLCNRVLVVDVPESLQLARTRQRDQIPEALAKQMMQHQFSREKRLKYADDVIENHLDLGYLQTQVNALHKKYLEMSRGYQ